MSYLTAVLNLINPNFLLDGKILPGEADCKDVNIKGSYSIIRTDLNDFKQNVLSFIFKPGQCRCISDYVIISDEIVLICEMKSRNEGNMKVQLKNSGKFALYILSMLKLHEKIVSAPPTVKYVCFAKAYSNKQTTRGGKLQSEIWAEGELFRLPCSSYYHLKQFI